VAAPAQAAAPAPAPPAIVNGYVSAARALDEDGFFGQNVNVYYADSTADLQGKTEAEYLKGLVTRYEKSRDEYKKKADELRGKSDKDVPDRDRQVARYDRAVKSYEEAIERIKKQIPEAERRAPYQKPVDVTFENASVQQAAEALSRASGVPIKVDEGIPADTRLTVKARHVRLSTVLEGIARQAGLILNPDKSRDPGVIITAPSSLSISVNGGAEVKQTGSRPSSPWSPEWGTPPNRRVYIYAPTPELFDLNPAFGGVVPGTTFTSALATGDAARDIALRAQGQALRESARALTIPRTSFSTLSKLNGITVGSGATVTSPSADTVVVSEPGKNDKGEKGYFITVYKIDKDGKLTKSSTTFHAASAKDKEDKEKAEKDKAEKPADAPATP
jgi:hypothetical protein